MPCIWLDGGVTKACRVLRARLGPLGYRIVCRTRLPDRVIAWLARRMGCVVVSTDKLAARLGWVYVPMEYASRKSARDLATHVIKLALSHPRGRLAAIPSRGGDAGDPGMRPRKVLLPAPEHHPRRLMSRG